MSSFLNPPGGSNSAWYMISKYVDSGAGAQKAATGSGVPDTSRLGIKTPVDAFTAFYDAHVLYPAALRNLLMHAP